MIKKYPFEKAYYSLLLTTNCACCMLEVRSLLFTTIVRGAEHGTASNDWCAPAGSGPLAHPFAARQRGLLCRDHGHAVYSAHRTGAQWAGSPGRTQPAHRL